MTAPNDLSEFKIVVEPPPPRRPRRPRRKIWWGLIGLFAGFIFGELVPRRLVTGRYSASVQEGALHLIYCVCIGAAVGFGIEFVSEKTWRTMQLQFGLRTLLAICYVIAVAVITIRNYLILISL